VSFTSGVINTLVSAYGFANRVGVLSNPLARGLFVRSYFLYKRFIEDSFAALTHDRPDLFRGGHLLDVGANIGYTAAVFARALPAGYRVYAFEPEERNFHDLEATIARGGLRDRIVPVRAAVGEREGSVDLWRNESHHGDHRVVTDGLRASGRPLRQTSTLPMVSIDGFAKQWGIESQIGFIKIDVQGFELSVCKGMQDTLRQNPQVAVAVEYAPEAMKEMGFDPAALLDFFSAGGFHIHALGHDGKLARVEPGSIASLTGQRGYADLVCARRRLDP
jgi:FkbM family methyltransferase